MKSGASSHAGWNRKRIKQYVLQWFLVFGIDINILVKSLPCGTECL